MGKITHISKPFPEVSDFEVLNWGHNLILFVSYLNQSLITYLFSKILNVICNYYRGILSTSSR